MQDNNPDRSDLVPPHRGPNVLPNSPLFGKLLRHARRERVALRDLGLDVEKTYGDLLDAVLSYREVVGAALPETARQSLDRGEEVYIGVLAAGGWEFTVATLAVMALGAAVVPMCKSTATWWIVDGLLLTIESPSAPAEEVISFVRKSRQVAILCSVPTATLGQEIADQISSTSHLLATVPILPNLPENPSRSALDICMSSDPPLDDRAPGLVIFTSGTTGRPKGVVHRRSYAHETALAIGEGYDLDHNDVLLHLLPVHHTTGLGTSFFPFLCAGACIEFRGAGSFDAAWVWERWLRGGLTVLSAVPTIFMRLKWHFERVIARLPAEEQQPYMMAARQFRALLCGSSALQDNVQDFWTSMRQGSPILTRYGATEFPGCLKVPADMDHTLLPRGCVGMPVPGLAVKLSEGDEGELMVKSPYMFAKYLDDRGATLAAHDSEGWFRTGDIARRDARGFYTIVGRASVDIIKSGGYKISALDVERACLALPYVAEAMVAGVEDEEFGQLVGALVAVKAAAAASSIRHEGEAAAAADAVAGLTLEQLRSDLRAKLAGYKLPTVLRVVEGELPKGGTGKVQKKVLGPQAFPAGYEAIPEVQVWRHRKRKQGQAQARL